MHGRYPQRTDNEDVDKVTTYHWLNSSSSRGETEDFIPAGQDQIIPTKCANQQYLKMGLTPNVGYIQATKRL